MLALPRARPRIKTMPFPLELFCPSSCLYQGPSWISLLDYARKSLPCLSKQSLQKTYLQALMEGEDLSVVSSQEEYDVCKSSPPPRSSIIHSNGNQHGHNRGQQPPHLQVDDYKDRGWRGGGSAIMA
jgi:hypothetical protein